MQSSVEKRRAPFERRTPSQHAELVGLFRLLDALSTSDVRVALSHYARDKLRAAFPRGRSPTRVVELLNGLDIEVDTGDLFGAEFFIGHCNEAKVINAISMTLPDGARVVDVGANFGVFALHAAHVAGGASRVVAFEPAPIAHQLLVGNVRRNGLTDRVDVRRMAVGAEPGITTFYVATDESFSGLRATGRSPLRESIEIEVASLDADEAVKALGSVDFLKIDTEGGEGEVLSGATETIRRSPGLVVLMEYSVKNLSDMQARKVRSLVAGLIEDGLDAWVIGADDVPVMLTSVTALPETFSGSLLLAKKESEWARALLSVLRAPEKSTPALAPPIAAALAGLMENFRDAQLRVSTARNDAASVVSGYMEELTDARQRLAAAEVTRADLVSKVKGKEADIAQLNSKLATANGLSVQLREALAKRQAGYDELEQKIREETKLHALARTELATARREVQIILELMQSDRQQGAASASHNMNQAYEAAVDTSLAGSIAALSRRLSAIIFQRDKLVVELADLTTAYEGRRDMIRALQQQVGLLRLGRHRKGSWPQ